MTIHTVAIVTGASRGLGRALAQGLLASDTLVVTVARRDDAALADEAGRKGGELRQMRADLSDPRTAQSFAAQLATAIPGGAARYVLINNAGSVDPVGLAQDLNDGDAIAAAFNLNVTAVMLVTAAFLRATAGAGDRRVLNISSGAGRNPTPGWGVYCATKAAVDRYTTVVASENHGVRVASLAPGVIDTGMQQHIRGSDATHFPNVERFRQLHETGQLASPAHTAGRILRYLDRDDFGQTVIDDIRHYDTL